MHLLPKYPKMVQCRKSAKQFKLLHVKPANSRVCFIRLYVLVSSVKKVVLTRSEALLRCFLLVPHNTKLQIQKHSY